MATPRLVLLSYSLQDGTTGNIAMDCSINEQHDTSAQITSHQVESGPNITDYIRPLPRKFRLEAMVSNYPIALPTINNNLNNGPALPTAQAQALSPSPLSVQAANTAIASLNALVIQFSNQFDRVRDVFATMVNAALNGAIWNITTTLTTYSSFALANMSVPRSAENGNVLRMSLDFVEVRIVNTQTITLAAVKRGHKATTPVDPASSAGQQTVKASSSLYRLAH